MSTYERRIRFDPCDRRGTRWRMFFMASFFALCVSQSHAYQDSPRDFGKEFVHKLDESHQRSQSAKMTEELLGGEEVDDDLDSPPRTSGNYSLTDSQKAFLDKYYGEIGVNYDFEDGKPFIQCAYKPESCLPAIGQPCKLKTHRCYIDLGNRGQRLGCMAAFPMDEKRFANATYGQRFDMTAVVPMMGCWQHSANVIKECKSDTECIGEPKDERASNVFCCCSTHNCNKKAWYREPFPEVQDEKKKKEKEKKEELQEQQVTPATWHTIADNSFLFGAIAIIIIMFLFMLVCIGIVKCRKPPPPPKEEEMKEILVQPQTDSEMKKKQVEEEERLIKVLKKNRYLDYDQLDNFDITDLKSVSNGRFGKVFHGYMRLNNVVQEVAVKSMYREQADSWFTEQAIYRLPSVQSAQHESVLRFIGSQIMDRNYWIITEFHALGSIFDFIQQNELPLKDSYRILGTALDGLAFLHEERSNVNKPAIAHRDIKSKNILLKYNAQRQLCACIADFGLAMKFISGVKVTESCGQVGTRRYMSPEILEGATEFTSSAFRFMDIYAMGLVIWEVLQRTRVGQVADETVPPYRVPFYEAGDAPTLGRMRDMVVTKKYRPRFREEIMENEKTESIAYMATEMWDQEWEARISAACAMDRVMSIYRTLPDPQPLQAEAEGENDCDGNNDNEHHDAEEHDDAENNGDRDQRVNDESEGYHSLDKKENAAILPLQENGEDGALEENAGGEEAPGPSQNEAPASEVEPFLTPPDSHPHSSAETVEHHQRPSTSSHSLEYQDADTKEAQEDNMYVRTAKQFLRQARNGQQQRGRHASCDRGSDKRNGIPYHPLMDCELGGGELSSPRGHSQSVGDVLRAGSHPAKDIYRLKSDEKCFCIDEVNTNNASVPTLRSSETTLTSGTTSTETTR